MKYKKNMERNHPKYKIVEQNERPDGSIIVYFKIQSDTFWCGYKSEQLCRN